MCSLIRMWSLTRMCSLTRSIKEWKALGDGNLSKIRRLGDNAAPPHGGLGAEPGHQSDKAKASNKKRKAGKEEEEEEDGEAVEAEDEEEEEEDDGEDSEEGEEEEDSDADAVEEESGEDEIFEAEHLVEKKRENGRWLWLVKWKGYSSKDNTWEPSQNLSKELIADFEKRQNKANVASDMADERSTRETDRGSRGGSHATSPPEKGEECMDVDVPKAADAGVVRKSINDVLGGGMRSAGLKGSGTEKASKKGPVGVSGGGAATNGCLKDSKAKSSIERIEKENADKVAKLDALKEKLGDQLNEKSRAALLNMKVSRKRLASESKNSAPKGDFQVDNPRLIDHRPAALTSHTAASSTSSSTSDDFAKYKIVGNEAREALVYGVEGSGGTLGGKETEEGAGGDAWMQELFDRLPQDFHIGLLVGDSGTGKTVFMKRFFGEAPQVQWRDDDAVISHFDSPDDASRRLMSVGLNAVPTWLKPYKVLSNGEKFRATLARQIGDGATIDNYTCITNRTVAASTSTSLVRLIRRYGAAGQASRVGGAGGEAVGFRRVVLATSYPDIIPYLSPDWVIFTNSRRLVVNVSPAYGPAITVDWAVSNDAVHKLVCKFSKVLMHGYFI